jgi:ribosome recycling factor
MSLLDSVVTDITSAEDHFRNELAGLQVGRAHPAIVENIMVDAYGSVQPLKNLASVSILDPQTLQIQAWDTSLLKTIEKGITEAKLGLNPQSMGDAVLVKIPTMTTERRHDMVKVVHRLEEEAKVVLRNIRHEYQKKIKKAKDDKIASENDVQTYEKDLQKHIDGGVERLEKIGKEKEKDILG